MQRQRQRRREEEADGDHVRRVVVEVQVLVADVGHPVQVAEDAVRETVAPGPHQHRTDHDQRDVGQDRHAEGPGHMQPHAQLAADFGFSQRPRDEGADGAHRDQLPQPAFEQRRHGQPVAQVGRRDADLPQVPGGALRGPPQDQRRAQRREKDRRHAEEADVERTDPEIEQVAADEGTPAHAILFLETQHGHFSNLHAARRAVRRTIVRQAGGFGPHGPGPACMHCGGWAAISSTCWTPRPPASAR